MFTAQTRGLKHYMAVFLVTGGAGFIGSRLVERLAAEGNRIVVLDNLHSQVHGPRPLPPRFPSGVSFLQGSVDDRDAVRAAISLASPERVFHLAAETGTGQSFDLVSQYCSVNVVGTAILLEELKRTAPRLERVVLAGSRAVYGEGAHRLASGAIITAPPRLPEQMKAGNFQPRDLAGQPLEPVPTPESFPPSPSSVYASTKLMQEHLIIQALAGTGIEPVILRFQNVFGPGQSLRNPYTGVLSIFCSQILAGRELNIYEDGAIVRDFVFVSDVVDALVRGGKVPGIDATPINIGSGHPATILIAARHLLRMLGASENALRISGDFRAGDIRYAVADIARAATVLGWSPETGFEQGLAALARWSLEEHRLVSSDQR